MFEQLYVSVNKIIQTSTLTVHKLQIGYSEIWEVYSNKKKASFLYLDLHAHCIYGSFAFGYVYECNLSEHSPHNRIISTNKVINSKIAWWWCLLKNKFINYTWINLNQGVQYMLFSITSQLPLKAGHSFLQIWSCVKKFCTCRYSK